MTNQERAIRLELAAQLISEVHENACKARDYKNALELYESLKHVVILAQKFKTDGKNDEVECVHNARRL